MKGGRCGNLWKVIGSTWLLSLWVHRKACGGEPGVLVASGCVSQQGELDIERKEGESWKAPAALDLPLIASDWWWPLGVMAVLLPPSRTHTASHWSARTQNHTEKTLTTEQNYADWRKWENCKNMFSSVQFSRSVVSDSSQPHEPQHARLPCPSPTPGVYPNSCPSSQWCYPAISSSIVPFSSFPQSLPASSRIKLPCITQCVLVLSLQACPTPCDLMDCSLPGSSAHGILQARILEWVAMPSSRNILSIER